MGINTLLLIVTPTIVEQLLYINLRKIHKNSSYFHVNFLRYLSRHADSVIIYDSQETIFITLTILDT